MAATENPVEQAGGLFHEHRQELTGQIEQVLRDALFSSRVYIRPSDVGRLAQQEIDAFFRFIADGKVDQAVAHGMALCKAGLAAQALLRTGAAYRRFLMVHLEESQRAPTLKLIDAYHEAILRGFIEQRETIILDEQEHIRSALQQALSRFALQVETAAEVARATVSILDMGELLTTAVDLISERFGLDYVGIYLIDDAQRYAELRAGTGDVGRRLLATGYRVSLKEESIISQCIAEGRYLISSRASAAVAAADSSWPAGPHSEIALPLVSRDQVIGALAAQSRRMDAFSSQDAPGLQIIADQLANAINNARLYREAQQRGDELAALNMRLQELDRLKDQFMQNVSHELRTPITIISGYAEAMLDGILGCLSEDAEQREGIEAIFRAARNLGILVDDIIAVVEASARPIQPRSVSLFLLCREGVDDVMRNATDKGIALRVEVAAPENNLMIMAEPNHIRRIIHHLLSNAIKFTPSGGQVVVRCYGADQHVVLEVEDTGIGIPHEWQQRIFDRFSQIDGTLHRHFGGAGLGLALVKQFAELYKGSVTVFSAGPGSGSTFKVILPVGAV